MIITSKANENTELPSTGISVPAGIRLYTLLCVCASVCLFVYLPFLMIIMIIYDDIKGSQSRNEQRVDNTALYLRLEIS